MRELVVSRCDAPPILEPAEAAFDDVAVLVGLLVMADFLLAVGFARNDGLDAVFFEKGSDRIGVIGFVGEEFLDAGDKAHAFFGHHAIGGVSGREDEGPGPAEFVDDRVDFAVATAFRNADRLKIGPPFPPWAQRWAFTWLESNATCSGGSEGVATHSNIFCQTPLALQRAKRL